ncbi:MAG TPA: DUF2153 domain-containing protein [Thermofilum sp.]|nr:DUF2153 domain-containing protein [Thermofilum sp.]
MEQFARSFGANLERWVTTQKSFLNSIKNVEPQLKTADRLELILAIRTVFSHMIRTIEAFDKWLQDPFIVGHMPREMLEEVQRKVWNVAKELLELDIAHTTQFKEYVEKLANEGKLNPLLYGGKREQERPGPRLSV